MNILIVGGSGFVGRNLLAHLASEMPLSQIYATYCKDHTFPSLASQYNATPIQIDLQDQAKHTLPTCDLCFMVAGSSNHGLKPEDAQNEIGAFLSFLRQSHHGKVILLSSGAVYFNQSGRMSEDAAIFPRFPYGTAKFTKEQYLQYFYDTGKIEQFSIVRLFYGFGTRERKTRLSRRVIEAIGAGQSSFTVSAQGQSFIDPLSIADVVRAIKEVGQSTQCQQQTINLCRGKPYRVHEFVSLIAQSLGKEIAIKYDHIPETYPVNFWGNASKLHTLTDFRPSSLQDDIRHYAHWIEQNQT